MINQPVSLVIASESADTEIAKHIREVFGTEHSLPCEDAASGVTLKLCPEGLALISEGQELKGDFTRMLSRIKADNLSREMLVRAAKIKDAQAPLTAIDATAGLGEDSMLLAAAGFRVTLCEWNPVIFELLSDALRRAENIPELAEIVGRMQAVNGNSVEIMRRVETPPDVILLDPMFPARQKSSLVKKKLQVIQKLEIPCVEERELILSAMRARPRKLIIKRPVKGPYLAGIKPDHSITGKVVRYDCFVSPYEKIHKYE